MKALIRILALPFEDFLSGLDRALGKSAPINIALIVITFVAVWWVYVPIHELCHAFGCMLGGGSVTKLEIDPKYGGAALSKLFPFVTSGSEYAGQLTGFDTGGNDLTYLLTDFFPFLLTIFIGVPLLRSASRSSPLAASLKLGVSLPIAFAPFISFSGDYYEMGSIVVSRIASILDPASGPGRLRSDDLFKLSEKLFFSGNTYGAGDVIGVVLSFILGVALIYATYFLGVLFSRLITGGLCHEPAS
ncbi:MAG TPA: M50 family metallopeptidase [Thermodesulfobacteriota bacterium]|nr:M50 family metallopeptidase [Thermodesulfobacteriota bacterium]